MSLKPQTGRVPKVETLPADGTGSPPLLAPRWPIVPVLPTPVVDGARYCVGASYDVAVEYLGRSVVELNGPDSITYTAPVANLLANSWTELFYFRDVVPGSLADFQPIMQCKNVGGFAILHWEINANGFPSFAFRNSSEAVYRQIDSSVNICDGEYHKLEVSFDAITKIAISCIDSVSCGTISLDTWLPDLDANSVVVSDYSLSTRPLQICNITQSLNGTLIDNIPCDESTGATLRNTVSQDRPATLSDANAHALAWVPQASKTYGVFIWNGSAWVPT